MNNNQFVYADDLGTENVLDNQVIDLCRSHLKSDGWILLRGFDSDLSVFSQLLSYFCAKLTFDPAREFVDESTQKVDAGTEPIGLHIENGNTPFPPDILGFYSKKSASSGSQTTICDGATIYEALSDELKQKFSQSVTVSRTLPERLWKSYAVNEHPLLNHADQVDETHLDQIMAIVPNHRGQLNNDGSLYYELDIYPLIQSQLSSKPAFANAILGPSFNYEPPVYTFVDGSRIDQDLKDEMARLAEQFTLEIPWQDGDMVLIDNKRVMHGRRAISDYANRELYIGMGLLAAQDSPETRN